ncbi:hypothetical protein BJ138DRAFT_1162248 [Hygrophoropsis aurantiaca]|uniref:Uncharacterized protein n=1 Tax=Hygrophoropsis aurantiaca TaxID=72124 RepID=A0ACB8A0Y1_9AGAM|nr:hypothetical protein BJ138DRAFT_1162248 [Hygrophoropsis aurantiaca]
MVLYPWSKHQPRTNRLNILTNCFIIMPVYTVQSPSYFVQCPFCGQYHPISMACPNGTHDPHSKFPPRPKHEQRHHRAPSAPYNAYPHYPQDQPYAQPGTTVSYPQPQGAAVAFPHTQKPQPTRSLKPMPPPPDAHTTRQLQKCYEPVSLQTSANDDHHWFDKILPVFKSLKIDKRDAPNPRPPQSHGRGRGDAGPCDGKCMARRPPINCEVCYDKAKSRARSHHGVAHHLLSWRRNLVYKPVQRLSIVLRLKHY